MKKNKKLAAAAILSALGVVILLLGSIITVLDLTMVAVASFLIILAVIEIGGAFPYLIWLVTGVLSLLLLPDKFGALIYLFFGGVYPIFKAKIERLHIALAWVVKLGFFNLLLTLMIVFANYIFYIPDTGMAFNITLFAVCNLAFICYDIASTQIITLYLYKLRKRLGIKKFFE